MKRRRGSSGSGGSRRRQADAYVYVCSGHRHLRRLPSLILLSLLHFLLAVVSSSSASSPSIRTTTSSSSLSCFQTSNSPGSRQLQATQKQQQLPHCQQWSQLRRQHQLQLLLQNNPHLHSSSPEKLSLSYRQLQPRRHPPKLMHRNYGEGEGWRYPMAMFATGNTSEEKGDYSIKNDDVKADLAAPGESSSSAAAETTASTPFSLRKALLPRKLASLEGGKPIADTLVDAAREVYGALLRRSRRLRLLRHRTIDTPSSTNGADATAATTAASVVHAMQNAEIALQEAEYRVLLLRQELENAKKEIAIMEIGQELQQPSPPLPSVLASNNQKDDEGGDEEEIPTVSNHMTIGKKENEDYLTNEQQQLLPVSSSDNNFLDLTSLSYDDVDYLALSMDMAPPFINEDECLIPGEPAVRVEKAPQNSRRIFAGIDIPVSVDEVWKLLTDYENLQRVVPNLVVNEVLELYPGAKSGDVIGDGGNYEDVDELSATSRCRAHALRMKGAVLKQVGGAKVAGINFSARTTLEVREWPEGMPDYYHHEDEVYLGKSRSDRAYEGSTRELERYVFPRPFALSSLPHKDISMQSVENDDGEFRMYQGVWRMQPLPGCSPPGGSAMRLTYAVEISPRPYLPVGLVEGRIARDLCANLKAIRDVFS